MSYLFEDEKVVVKDEIEGGYWHILSVDDEPSIHQITKLVLAGFTFENKKIKLSTASSAQEAIDYLKHHSDVALVLLDIVMERDDAGFDVANYLRSNENNHTTRIIIRTGQPGNLPEHEILKQFDVDGFTEKTELSTEKLHAIIYSSLRAYRDIVSIQQCKTKLETLIESMSHLTTSTSFEQLHKRLKEEAETLIVSAQNLALATRSPEGEINFIFADNAKNDTLIDRIHFSATTQQHLLNDDSSISYHALSDGSSLHFCIEPDERLCTPGKKVLLSLSDAVCLIYLHLSHPE